MSETEALLEERRIKELYIDSGFPIIDGEGKSAAFAQRRGIERAKKAGVVYGRPKIERPDNWDSVISLWRAGEITAVEAMRRTGLKRGTFYNMVKTDCKKDGN